MTSREADNLPDVSRLQNAAAAGGVLGALAASSCCMLPLLLFTLGASGPWIGTLVRLAPYQPYFIAVAVGCLGCGYWLLHRSSTRAKFVLTAVSSINTNRAGSSIPCLVEADACKKRGEGKNPRVAGSGDRATIRTLADESPQTRERKPAGIHALSASACFLKE
jgi:mercuric ion transport protein